MQSSTTPGNPANLTQLLLQGQRNQEATKADAEGRKLGNLRGGNSGIMSEQGDVAASCHRKAHVRALGIQIEKHSPDKLLMFELGIANEDIVYNKLLAALPEGYTILRESEIPTVWKTKNGTKVTGRPDMVVGRAVDLSAPGIGLVLASGKKFVPDWGIELKSVASVYTTAEVLFQGQPKVGHLTQAAHYMWQLGIPYRLNYKQFANQVGPSWLTGKFPKQGQPGSEHISYNDKGEVKYVNPFEVTYELQWGKGGMLEYRLEGTDYTFTRTLISAADIERFYEAASIIGETGDLGKRPMTIDAHGKEKSYSDCHYCPLKSICDKVDKSTKARPKIEYSQWLEEVRTLSKNLGE